MDNTTRSFQLIRGLCLIRKIYMGGGLQKCCIRKHIIIIYIKVRRNSGIS